MVGDVAETLGKFAYISHGGLWTRFGGTAPGISSILVLIARDHVIMTFSIVTALVCVPQLPRSIERAENCASRARCISICRVGAYEILNYGGKDS